MTNLETIETEGAAPRPIAAPAPAPPAPSRATPRAGGVRGLAERLIGRERIAMARSVARMVSRDELKVKLPLGDKLWAWAHGFEAQHAALHDRARLRQGDFVTDYERHHRVSRLSPIPALFDEKMLMRHVLHGHGVPQPETVGIVMRHMAVRDPLGRPETMRPADFMAWLRADGGRYIVKPQRGSYGSGIALIEPRDGQLVIRRGRSVKPFRPFENAPPERLFERAVEQHDFWAALSPHSVNTMRILTLWAPGDPEPFVGGAVQRVGTEETLPTDNWGGGAMCAPVDLATGELRTARIFHFESAHPDRPYTHHPDTGAPIAGLRLPFWDDILRATLAAARVVPYSPYVGWDVAIDRAGRPVFIEGNRNTGLQMLQLEGGLLRDPRIRDFFARTGVL